MTLQFLAYAAAQLALFVWLAVLWRRTRAPAAAVLLVPQFFLFYDNFIVAIGSSIGVGPTLEALSWPRFWAHWLTGYWIIIAAGSILRLADFGWARRPLVMGAFCVLTAALLIHEIPNLWLVELHPICEHGLVRYTTHIAPGQSCVDPAYTLAQRDSPLAVIIANFVVIGVGAVLALRRRFPWMFLGAVLMLMSAAVPALRALKLDNLGEILIAAGLIAAIARFAPRRRSTRIAFRTPS